MVRTKPGDLAFSLPLPLGEGWGEGKKRRGKQVKIPNLITLLWRSDFAGSAARPARPVLQKARFGKSAC